MWDIILVETKKENSGLYKHNVKNFLFNVKHISVFLERSETTMDRGKRDAIFWKSQIKFMVYFRWYTQLYFIHFYCYVAFHCIKIPQFIHFTVSRHFHFLQFLTIITILLWLCMCLLHIYKISLEFIPRSGVARS